MVLDSPYFGVSDKEGKINIRNLPAGEWEFQVWHEKAGYLEVNDWAKGRFTQTIKEGDNDLGVLKVTAKMME